MKNIKSFNESNDNTSLPPTEDQIIDTIMNCVYIRGIDLELLRTEFTEERSGLITALNKLYGY